MDNQKKYFSKKELIHLIEESILTSSKKELIHLIEESILTKKELLNMLEKNLKEYRLDANKSLRRNSHMNYNVMQGRKDTPQEIIDSLLVDFVNYVGKCQGLDYGLYTKHLFEK